MTTVSTNDTSVKAAAIAAPVPVKKEEIGDTLSYVRLSRVMRSDNGDLRWRAMYERSGAQWLTLYPKDVKLLTICQSGKAEDYDKKEHVYLPTEQPLISLSEEQNTYSLHSVYFGNRYLTHEEGDRLMTEQNNKPAVQDKQLTMEQISAQIETGFQTRKAARISQRPTDSTMFTPDDERRENAEALLDVSIHIDSQQDKLGKIQMAALWRLRSSGDFRALPNSPQNITQIVRDNQYKNRDYVLSHAMVVDRIFPSVEALFKAGKPFVNPVTGDAITVDSLITSEGLIMKLTKSSNLFEKLTDLEDRRKLIGAIVTKTREEVAALREELAKVLISGTGGGETGGQSESELTDSEPEKKADDLITAMIELIPSSKPGAPGKSRIVLDDLDEAQKRAVLTILKPLLKNIQQ